MFISEFAKYAQDENDLTNMHFNLGTVENLPDQDKRYTFLILLQYLSLPILIFYLRIVECPKYELV